MNTNRTDEIENWFTHHPPANDVVVITYEEIRYRGRQFAHMIDDAVPDGIEKDNAIAALSEAVMWANAGIACQTTA
jgi:hypothetical protein